MLRDLRARRRSARLPTTAAFMLVHCAALCQKPDAGPAPLRVFATGRPGLLSPVSMVVWALAFPPGRPAGPCSIFPRSPSQTRRTNSEYERFRFRPPLRCNGTERLARTLRQSPARASPSPLVLRLPGRAIGGTPAFSRRSQRTWSPRVYPRTGSCSSLRGSRRVMVSWHLAVQFTASSTRTVSARMMQPIVVRPAPVQYSSCIERQTQTLGRLLSTSGRRLVY